MLKNLFALLSLAALLSGCSSLTKPKLTVTLDAQPATAKLYLHGALYGQGSSKYTSIKLTNEQLERGTYTIEIPEARWPSGTSTPQSRKTLSLDTLSHHVFIKHPDPDSATGRYDRLRNHSFDVMYKASPPTAEIFLDGTLLGQSPATKTYEITLKDSKKGYIALPEAEARWPSGTVVAQEHPENKIDNRQPTSQTLTFVHPAPDTPAGKFDQRQKHTVTVRYYSEPSMALLFSDRTNLGRAPAYRSYSYSFSDYERGYLELNPIQARWTSGAMTNSGPVKVQLNRSAQELTFIRPEYPNLEADLATVYREEEKARLEKTDAKNLELMERHYRKMEQMEKEKFELEKEKLELLERRQAAEEKERAELLRLRKLEVENNLKQQQEKPSGNVE